MLPSGYRRAILSAIKKSFKMQQPDCNYRGQECAYCHLQTDIEHICASNSDDVSGASVILSRQNPERKALSDHGHVGI